MYEYIGFAIKYIFYIYNSIIYRYKMPLKMLKYIIFYPNIY